MFSTYRLTGDGAALKEAVAPDLLVLTSEQEFETMPTDWLFELALVTDDIETTSYQEAWIPATAPRALQQLTGNDPVIGAAGDGGVTWTRQTDPPIVFLKPRTEGIPEAFLEFLVAEAMLDVVLSHPEHPLDFFAADYPLLQEAVGGDPGLAHRLSGALTEAWCGLGRRERFRAWDDAYPSLYAAWRDAGERLAGRIQTLPSELASGSLGFAAATELACSAIKHDIRLPQPFDALDVAAYREHGSSFAIRWTERTFAQLDSIED